MRELDTNNHSVFAMYYHLVLAVKYRRKDYLHKLSTHITSENQTIVIEDLRISNIEI